jgi:hypothetical protein
MKKPPTYIAAVLILLSSSSSLLAQDKKNNDTSESVGPTRFWQVSVAGGDYMVALDRISSISKHTYVIDGGLRVTEVVIDTNGNSLVRFYYIIPVSEDSGSTVGAGLTSRAQELLNKAGERTGVNGNTVVAKQYPTTTHAKTVEFRISDEGNLNKLYANIRKAWIKGRGNKFTIKSN